MAGDVAQQVRDHLAESVAVCDDDGGAWLGLLVLEGDEGALAVRGQNSHV